MTQTTLDVLLEACNVEKKNDPLNIYYVVPSDQFRQFVALPCDNELVEVWVMQMPNAALAGAKPKSY